MSDVNNLELIQSKLPHWYKKYEKDKSVLYAVISALAKQLDINSDSISRIDEMIGIETTRDEDLEYRWGSLLGMPKSANESYDDYRYKLMMTYSSLINGGTVESLKFAIASILGINRRSDDIDKYIKIYDAWEYNGDIPGYDPTTAKYGSFVCVIDFRLLENIGDYYTKLYSAINKTKASGTVPYFMVLYISEDDINVKFNEYAIDKIKDVYSENGCIPMTRKAQIPLLNGCGLLNTMFTLNSYKDYGYDPDVVFDIIKYTINDSCNIDRRKVKMFDRMSPLVTNQDVTNEYMDTDADTMHIIDGMSDSRRFSDSDYIVDTMDIHDAVIDSCKISDDDNLSDNVACTIQEESNICSKSNLWSGMFGTNSLVAVLNSSLITNMVMDTDECADIITMI